MLRVGSRAQEANRKCHQPLLRGGEGTPALAGPSPLHLRKKGASHAKSGRRAEAMRNCKSFRYSILYACFTYSFEQPPGEDEPAGDLSRQTAPHTPCACNRLLFSLRNYPAGASEWPRLQVSGVNKKGESLRTSLSISHVSFRNSSGKCLGAVDEPGALVRLQRADDVRG